MANILLESAQQLLTQLPIKFADSDLFCLLLQVLKETGLKQSIDKQTFTHIAQHIDGLWRRALSVEAAGEYSRDEIWDMAMLACDCLKENAGRLHDTNLYQALRGLRIAPAIKVGS